MLITSHNTDLYADLHDCVSNVGWIILRPSLTIVFRFFSTALGRLGHPDGEKCLTRAGAFGLPVLVKTPELMNQFSHLFSTGAQTGVIQMIPTLASCSFDEIMDEGQQGQNIFMQLYVNKVCGGS